MSASILESKHEEDEEESDNEEDSTSLAQEVDKFPALNVPGQGVLRRESVQSTVLTPEEKILVDKIIAKTQNSSIITSATPNKQSNSAPGPAPPVESRIIQVPIQKTRKKEKPRSLHDIVETPKAPQSDVISISTQGIDNIKRSSKKKLILNSNSVEVDTGESGFIRGYTRVSTVEQKKEGISLESQKEKITSWGKYKNYTVSKFYTDEGISGKDYSNRDQLIQLLRDLKEKEYVVVCSLNRLARNVKQMIEIEEFITSKKAYLVALDYDVNTKTAVGRLIFNVIGSISQFEREATSEKVSMNLQYLSAQKRLRGKPPYGWRFTGKNQPFVKDEHEQSVIEQIRQWKKDYPQLTCSAICRILEDRCIPKGKSNKWYPNVLKKIMEDNSIPI